MPNPSRPPAEPSARPPSLVALAAIRVALLLGVLLFGAITMFLHRRGLWAPASVESLETLRLIGIGTWAFAVIGVIVLRARGLGSSVETGAEPSIIGWAIGEAVAMFGAVQYFLSGRPAWYINGVLFLLATFVIFPIRNRRP